MKLETPKDATFSGDAAIKDGIAATDVSLRALIASGDAAIKDSIAATDASLRTLIATSNASLEAKIAAAKIWALLLYFALAAALLGTLARGFGWL